MGKHGAEYTRVEREPPPSLYERGNAAAELPYDAADDFSRSIDDCYAAVRERKARGGKGCEPRS